MNLYVLLPLTLAVLLAGCAGAGPAQDVLTEPPALTVRCWSDTLWGDTSAPAETMTVEDLTFSLPGDGCIYEVIADWTWPQTWGGTAHDSFHAGPEAPQET